MKLKELNKRPGLEQDEKLLAKYRYFETLIIELHKRKLPNEIVAKINQDVEKLNTFSESDNKWIKEVGKAKRDILKLLEKDLKLVPKNYYRKQWMAVGMSAFGIPLGITFGMSMDNMGFIGIGLPIGMAIGIGVGTNMDKKAEEEGRQLAFEG